MHRIFSFSNINKTQGHTMNLNDFLNFELYNSNLKMFTQASEETLLAFGDDLDEGVVEKLYERDKVRKSTLMKNASTLYHSDVVLKKEP